jgi:hypothetical protein
MKSLLMAALAVILSLTLHTPSYAQAPEQLLPGNWTATSPQGSTTFHMDIRNAVKSADGSVSFEGEMWTTGAVPTGKGKMEGAQLVGDKATMTLPFGNASFALKGQELVGFVTFNLRVIQDLRFSKK